MLYFDYECATAYLRAPNQFLSSSYFKQYDIKIPIMLIMMCHCLNSATTLSMEASSTRMTNCWRMLTRYDTSRARSSRDVTMSSAQWTQPGLCTRFSHLPTIFPISQLEVNTKFVLWYFYHNNKQSCDSTASVMVSLPKSSIIMFYVKRKELVQYFVTGDRRKKLHPSRWFFFRIERQIVMNRQYGAIQVLHNVIFLEIGPPPTPS